MVRGVRGIQATYGERWERDPGGEAQATTSTAPGKGMDRGGGGGGGGGGGVGVLLAVAVAVVVAVAVNFSSSISSYTRSVFLSIACRKSGNDPTRPGPTRPGPAGSNLPNKTIDLVTFF